MNLSNIPVFILCGGLGTRIREEGSIIPKPMVTIGEHPILWHIMHKYAKHGFRKFILCLGFKSDVIKQYFRNFHAMNSDCTINLKTNHIKVHECLYELDWDVTLAYTGKFNMTGSRIAQAIDKYLNDAEHFAVTYGDGLTNADLSEEFSFHIKNRRIGTVLGVNPPSRFGEIIVENEVVKSFSEKPDIKNHWINGGYFLFQRDFRNYLSSDPACILEQLPLSRLANDAQLGIFKHSGFWACMDTPRDREYLTKIVEEGDIPWFK